MMYDFALADAAKESSYELGSVAGRLMMLRVLSPVEVDAVELRVPGGMERPLGGIILDCQRSVSRSRSRFRYTVPVRAPALC